MGIRTKHIASVAATLILAAGVAGCDGDKGSADPAADKQEQQDGSNDQEQGSGDEEAGEDEQGDDDQGQDEALTLSGTVEAGTEPGCMLLEFEGETYQLTGDKTKSIEADAEVEVTGQVTEGAMTSCQEGTPFEVDSVSQS